MTAPLASNRGATLAVVAGLAAWTAVLWPLHGLLPMWVEGMPAYLDQLLGVLGRACTPPVNVVELWGRTIPLAIDGYQGPLMTYLDVPVARAWLGALTDDPYVYRYKGIVLLAISGILLFMLLRRVASAAIAALGALVFVTLPANAVTAISDLQYHVPLLTVILAILLTAVKYVETQRPVWLFATTFAAGAALLTRAEALIWTVAAATVWLALARRAQILYWWRTTPRKVALALGAMAALLLGSAPIVAMNLIYPSYGLLSFLLVAGPARVIDSGSFIDALTARGSQFLDFILLNRFDFYSASVPHYAYMVLAVASAACLAWIAMRERRWPLALVAIIVVLPLSAIGHRHVPREIHLLPLMIPIVAIVTEACGRLRPHFGGAILLATLVANLVVGGLVLENWQALRERRAETMLSHSCPECLAKALQRYGGASLRFTNLGLYHEALWASRAHACGTDILHWGDEVAFADAVREAMRNGGRVVFVGYPKDREDRLAGRVLKRADALAATLQKAGADYREELVLGPNGRPFYQLTVLGELPSRLVVTGSGVNAPAAGRITGWVLGRGFRRDDKLSIDGVLQSPYFGHEGLVTFSIDATAHGAKDRIVVEMTSADGRTRSAPVTVPLR
jgi:hypothetical protein